MVLWKIADRSRRIPVQTPSYGEEPPYRKAPQLIKNEIEALRRMRSMSDDAPGPQLIASKCAKQDDDMWVPGGYICFLLMQLLPGISLSYDLYWSWSEQRRECIRAAFKESFE